MNILFVCTGNTCRSFMAQAAAEHVIRERGLSGSYEVRSAGIAAMTGDCASPTAVEALAREGIPAPGHSAQPLTPVLCDWADVIVAMTPRHKAVVEQMCADANVVVPEPPVADPFGGDVNVYLRSLHELQEVVGRLLP